MSDPQLCQETPVLLTRKEVRKVLRINERTIDCWLRKHKLEALAIPGDSDAEGMIALCDDGLRERFKAYIETHSEVSLAIDDLPAPVRCQLLEMKTHPASADNVDASIQNEGGESMPGDEIFSLVHDVAKSVVGKIVEQFEDEEQMLPDEDEVWLALEGVNDPAILAGTEKVLFNKDRPKSDAAPVGQEVIEIDLVEDQDGDVGLLVEEEGANGDIEAASLPEAQTEPEPEQFEVDPKTEEWLLGGDMIEALSHSPVFAEDPAPGTKSEHDEEEEARLLSAVAESAVPTQIEIDELFQSIVSSQEGVQPERNEFVSEEVVVLYRVEEQLARMEAATLQHHEDEYAELAEVRADIAATWDQEAVIIETVGNIEKDMSRLRMEAKETSKTARSSLAVSRRTQSQIKRRLKSLGIIRVGDGAAAALPVAAGVLITSWAMTIYIKTGDLRMALGGLVLVNLLACASLLHSKTGRFF